MEDKRMYLVHLWHATVNDLVGWGGIINSVRQQSVPCALVACYCE